MGKFAVVLMTGSQCAQYPGTTCVMELRGPFETREEADTFAGQWPDWTAPHIMSMRPPDGDEAP
jgi:hypothetical protein